jgi:ATP-dependent Clp protease ATP-binding subunit ClpA
MKYDTSRLTPRMVRCLERADEFAESFGQDYTGVEHVVLSILADGDAAPTVVADRIGALGVLVYELDNYCRTGEVRPSATKLVPDAASAADSTT